MIKDKLTTNKDRQNLNQSINTSFQVRRPSSIYRKNLDFILLLKKFNDNIDFKNVKVLKLFLTKNGKIQPRRKTRISSFNQRKIASAIKKARAYNFLPFTCNVNI